MERVAARIQAYVDHSRFLTVQSAQMLRNSVVKVASRKAEEALQALPPEKQADAAYTASQEFRRSQVPGGLLRCRLHQR